MKVIQYLASFLLKFVKPGYYIEPLFNQMCRLNTLTSIEIIPFKNGKVCLTKRSDKFFGEVWHIPGTMVRGNELTNYAYYRLLFEEFGEYMQIIEPVKFTFSYEKETKRGNIVHNVQINGDKVPVNGTWFSVKRLPKNTLDYHRSLIKKYCK